MNRETEQRLRKQAWAMSLDLLQRKVSALLAATTAGEKVVLDKNLAYDMKKEVCRKCACLEEVMNALNIVLIERLYDEFIGEEKYEENED